MSSIRAVIDTNIFVNGLFKNEDFAKAVFQLKMLNKITFVMNKEMQNELLCTFTDILIKALQHKKEINKLIDIIPLVTMLSKCLWQVEEIDRIIHTDYCKEDKSDNKFIDCCIDGNINYLITQDMHINSVADEIKEKYNIEVLSPMQFYTRYKSNQL